MRKTSRAVITAGLKSSTGGSRYRVAVQVGGLCPGGVSGNGRSGVPGQMSLQPGSTGLYSDSQGNAVHSYRRYVMKAARHVRSISDLGPGDHVCCFLESEEERLAVISAVRRRRPRAGRQGPLHLPRARAAGGPRDARGSRHRAPGPRRRWRPGAREQRRHVPRGRRLRARAHAREAARGDRQGRIRRLPRAPRHRRDGMDARCFARAGGCCSGTSWRPMR